MSSAIAPSMKTKPQKDYTLGEEIFNAVTHGVGVLLAIAAIPLCVVQAVTHGGGLLLAAALIYSITMVVEYLMSTLYHAIAVPAAKRVFKVLDHCGIYLYIAGCYARGGRHLLYDRCCVLYLHEKEEVHALGLSPVGARWLYLPVLFDLLVRACLRKCA